MFASTGVGSNGILECKILSENAHRAKRPLAGTSNARSAATALLLLVVVVVTAPTFVFVRLYIAQNRAGTRNCRCGLLNPTAMKDWTPLRLA
jgi:hypothetical protein